MGKETRELVRSSDAHVDTETGSASEHLGAPVPSGTPRPKATIVAIFVVALSLGIVGFIGISSVQKHIERAPAISKQGAPVGISDFPTSKVQNRSRMGCSNWQSIALTLPALLGHSQDSCDKLCSSTKGCFYSNFQVSECQGDDLGVAPGACYLFGPGCKLKETKCWDLNVVPGPPAFKLDKPRTGCSNWLDISLQETKHVENMFRCSTECTAVNCSAFIFAPENGSCHVIKDNCTEVENADHDLYRAIRMVHEYTWTAESIEAPHHHVVVPTVSGFAATTEFFMLYPTMRAEPVTVVQPLPSQNIIMFSPQLHENAFEGSVLYTLQSHSTGSTAIILTGATVLPTASNEGFSIGQTITIIGGGNQEWRTIVGFGSLLIDKPLENDYPLASLITPSDGPATPAPTSATPAPTACWPTGTEVRIVPGSKYDDGSTQGLCARIGQQPLCSDEPQMLTFGNNFQDEYQHSDVEEFVCPTAEPTLEPTPEPTQVAATGGCSVDSATQCVRSPNYPSEYGNSEHCTFAMDFAIKATSFVTEIDCDFLYVNGVKYDGTSGPSDVTPTTIITWTSDNTVTMAGWELCPVV